MTAREWVNANFMIIYESAEGFGVCAGNGEQGYITRKEAEDAAERVTREG
ncbi:hypothetical protein [Lysobacter sp. F6437]